VIIPAEKSSDQYNNKKDDKNTYLTSFVSACHVRMSVDKFLARIMDAEKEKDMKTFSDDAAALFMTVSALHYK
jgi:hypothetical protein